MHILLISLKLIIYIHSFKTKQDLIIMDGSGDMSSQLVCFICLYEVLNISWFRYIPVLY